jgi:hypothetical protein
MSFQEPLHMAAGSVDRAFVEVVIKAAEKTGKTFFEQLVQFAIAGADCQRRHDKKDQHVRKQRTTA